MLYYCATLKYKFGNTLCKIPKMNNIIKSKEIFREQIYDITIKFLKFN